MTVRRRRRATIGLSDAQKKVSPRAARDPEIVGFSFSIV